MQRSIFASAPVTLASALCLVAGLAWGAEPPVTSAPLQAYIGESGYQEVPLAADRWYLAYHGVPATPPAMISAGWLGRARQLCAGIGKPWLVELKFVDQPVYQHESMAAQATAAALPVRGAAPVFIYVPTYTGPLRPVTVLSKAATLRCLDHNQGLRDGITAIAVTGS